MIGYPYIAQLFQTILKNSLVMQGRFYVCPKWGSEMANPNIEEQLAIGEQTPAKKNKYPATLLMPPPKSGNFEYGGITGSGSIGMADRYNIRLLFVATDTITGANQVMQPTSIGISNHSIPDTWHDMDRVAQNFISVLRQLLAGNNYVVIMDDITPRISPVTNLGNDMVGGVMLSFQLAVFSGCTIEDYAAGWQTAITLPPATDIHPIHSM